MEVRYYYFGKMSAEELAQHRQEYWDELVRFLDGYRYGPRWTELEMRQLHSEIPDSEIIYNVEHGISPDMTIQRFVYIASRIPS